MPIFEYNNQKYSVADEHIDSFSTKYPDATTIIEDEGKKYKVKSSDYNTFVSRHYKTNNLDFSSPSVSVEPAQVIDSIQPADPVAQVKQDSFANETESTSSQQKKTESITHDPSFSQQAVENNEPEYVKGFGQGFKQGWKGLVRGTHYLIGETANLFTGSTIDEEKALARIAELEKSGIDVESSIAPLDKAQRMIYSNIANPSPEVHIKATDGQIAFARQALEDDAINKTIRKYIEKTGSLEEAKKILTERANEETWGDRQMKIASQKLSELKPTKGFGAWVGNLAPQMIPTAASIGVGAITKNPKLTKGVGAIGMGTMTASTAGMSMNEAREAGATGLQTWAVGIADGTIEFLTEKIPFDIYTSKLLSGVKKNVGNELAEAVTNSPQTRNELERLLQEANKRLGGKLFNGKNAKDFAVTIVAEGASEAVAEALQTITPMIYENPEDYPTIGEILKNGWEGAKAGVFMGSVLGGASKTMEHYQQKNRRKDQGFVDVVEFETKDEHKIGEALGMTDRGVAVLTDGKIQYVIPENIIYSHRFSFEEFDTAELQMESDESYDNGYSMQDPQEMNDVNNNYLYQREMMAQMFGIDESDIESFLGEDPIATAVRRRQNGESEEGTQAIIDYLNAKATYDGMLQSVRDDIDGQIEQSNALIDSYINKGTGMVHGAVLKEGEQLVYIVNGNAVAFEDGVIDNQNTSQTIIVKDAATGELKQISPTDIASLYDIQDPNEQKEMNAQRIRDGVADEALNKINGVVDFGANMVNQIGNTIGITMVLTERGFDKEYIKTFLANAQIVENPDGTLTFTDGQNNVVVPKQEIQQKTDAANMERVAAINEHIDEVRKNINNPSSTEEKDVSLQTQEQQDEVSQRISQNNNGTQASQNGRMEEAAIRLRSSSETFLRDSGKSQPELSESEVKEAESYAKGNGLWIPFDDVFNLGNPGKGGNENETYFSPEGNIYKVNNLMNSGDIASLLERLLLHNQIFPETAYELVGFTGFEGRSVYPIVRQRAINNPTEAIPEEIEAYMTSLGFTKISETEYANNEVIVSDLHPRNVLKDSDGDIYVVDAEFKRTKSSLIPKDESGNPIYEQADPATAWDALMEEAEGDEEIAMSVAQSMIADKEKELSRLEKTKVKEGSTVAEKTAAHKAHKAAIEQARQNVDAWRSIAGIPAMRQQAELAELQRIEDERAAQQKAEIERIKAEQEEAARLENERLNGIPDYTEDTPQNARTRGYRRVNGHFEQRQQPLQAVQGKETEVEFSNEVRPKGRYAVIDSSQLQPSHIQGNRNPMHFLDEAQPKERNDNASIMSAQKIAGNIRPATITTGETAYVGTPTVNARGEVIQGNSRSDALKLMYGNHKDQGQIYKQYLIDNAEQFGLNPEDIANMENPVLVRMLDVSDEQAITLGQYVAQDTESGGVERIKPKNAVKKMGGDMRTFANILLDSADEDLSFAELLDSNGVKVLKWMNQKGYITDTQYSSAFDSKGNLTGDIKNDLRGIMYQSIFQGGSTRLEEMFNALPAKAQKAILATAHRDFSSPSSESMIKEIQSSIHAFYALMQDAQFAKAKNFKEADKAADAWQKQYQMDDITGESYLPSEKFTNFALHLAKMYKGEKQSNIQSTFEELYDLIQGAKEDNLFEQADKTPRTLVQAIKEVLNIDYNGQRRSIILDSDIAPSQQGQHGRTGNVASEKRTESGERTDDNSGRTETDSNERQTDAASRKIETESSSDDRTIQTVHQSGSEREGLEQTLDGRRQADSPRMADNTAGIMETGNDRSDIRVFEEGLATSYREHSEYSERARRTAESERLVNIAKQHGLFIPAEDTNALTGKQSKRTGESVVYIDTETGIVTKVKDPYAKSAIKSGVQPEDAVFEHLVHNLLFPETAYTFEGISEDMGDVRIVLSQSLIQSKGHPTKEQIAEALAERGLFPEDKYSFGNEFVSVTDVEGDNVILGEDGNLYFIDPIIRFKKPLRDILDNYNSNNGSTLGEQIKAAEKEVNTFPTDKQKEAGNYKKGHVQVGTFNITIEQPKGSVRSGVDANGRKWETTMQNTYGYIRGTEGVDGDHIDVFLSDDIDGWNSSKVFVVDQYNEDGTFDEHKVMLGFNTIEDAESAYLANYEKGWEKKHKIVVSPIHTEEFEKWIDSSHRKTKAFAEYKSVQSAENRTKSTENDSKVEESSVKDESLYTIEPAQYTTKKGKVLDMHLVKFTKPLSKEQQRAAKDLAKAEKGWYDREQNGFMMRNEESARNFADTIISNEDAVSDAQPVSMNDIQSVNDGNVLFTEPQQTEQPKAPKNKNVHVPIWQYIIHVDDDGYTMLSREDISGEIPILDDWGYSSESPEEMLEILRNPQNNMQEVLNAVEVALENKIKTRDFDRKIREEREQKRIELRTNGVNGYKIGERVIYTPVSGTRKPVEATIHDFEEYGDNKPVLDTGLAPVMYEVVEWENIKKTENPSVKRPQKSDVYKNNMAGGNAVAFIKDVTNTAYLVAFASNLEDAQDGLFMGDNIVDFKEMDNWLTDGSLTKIEKKEEYDANDNQHSTSSQQQTVNPSGNRLVTDERYEELKQRMRRKLGGQMNIGIDPEILAIGTEMAVYHLEKGARKFAEYAKSMIADLGDTIRPYLKAFYNGARELPEVEENGLSAEMTPYEDVQSFDVANFGKTSINAIETAETTVRESEVEKEVKIANERIKKTRNTHNNKKKTVTSQGQTGSLFDDLFNNENTNEDGLQRHDEVRSEGLSADNSRYGEGLSESTGESSQRESEDNRGTDSRGKKESRTVDRTVRPRLSDSITEKKNTNNNHSERGIDHAPTSVDARIDANIKAIEVAKQLIESGEKATKEQMEILRKFSGWGGLGKAFNERATYVHEGRHYYNEPTVENKKIRELLGEEAYKQAVMSANSAYYTPSYVIDTLWDIAEQMGFKGGNILEGSAGIGNILGQMPTHISERSDIHAIEIDGTSGGILSLLYPDAKVEIQGFEETHIANGSVDLAITNVPFVTGLRVNDTKGDKDLSKKFHNIHDFCIAKNVRKLSEGGLGIFITSNGTLDNSKKLREWIVSEGNADFVGVFRMHNKTFGGTGVTSDIIVIRKRVNGKKSANAIDVSAITGARTAEYDTGETRKVKGIETPVVKQLSMDYNRYFIEHPEMMAGEMQFGFEKGDTYRPTSKGLYPVQGKNQEQMLADFVKSFKEEEVGERTSANKDVIDALSDKKVGEMFVKDGILYINAIGAAQPLDVNANKVKGHTKVECFEAYSSIKAALKDVLDYQTANENDNGLKPLLAKLNKAYDDFVSTYGHFNKNTSIAFLRNDVDYANVFALEKFEETADRQGNKIQKFEKTDVFSKRVIEKDKEPTPTNVKDGIIASIFKFGRVDVPYIAEHLGKSESEIKDEIIIGGYGFEDPTSRQIEVSYQYLSGNVREKLLQAKENNENGEFDRNIKALQDVLPMDIPAHLIDFTLGSSWIDSKLYDEYVKDRTDVNVQFTAVGGTWFMKEPYNTSYEKNRAMGVSSEMLGKTIMGHTLIEAAITNKSITVSSVRRNWDGTSETIIDKEATQACAAKIDEIRQDFKEWARQKMQSDSEMSKRLERIYNDTFNNYVPMSIPDEFVPKYFGGASHKFEMRPHQSKAIVRGTMQPLLLAHEVGTGKTFTLISTAMEMRRLGTARKPMIVVQNATVGQFVASAKELYPNAKILTLEDGDRNAEGRKNFYAKIRYNDWDMIVVPQSTFEFIPDSEEREMAFIQDKIEEKMLILEQMKNEDPDGSSMITRQAEREIALLEEELAGLSELSSKKRTANDEKKRAVALQNAEVKAMEMLDRRTDDVENFDDMGIDALLIDEAHEYKHLGFATAMQRGVKGVDPSYSKKSQGVFLKTQAVLENNNGRNVIFATGTPISNTAAEIWTFMRYLMPADTMKEYGIYYFDDFVRNFGNIQQMLEFTTSGKFKENNRFAGYVNLPELVRIWSGISDTVLTKEAGGVKDKIPEIEGGKAQDIYLPQTRALRSIMKFVKAQLEAFDQMSGKMKKENSHIPLTMYGIAKAAAVDARLVQPDAEDDPNSKTNEAVRQTLRSLKETESYKGTIAIFADNYQNKQSGFNLYEDIRSKLINEGISSNEIVVIKSGMTVKKKLEIFDKVNRGEIRVILGSTFTLGTGVNIQERLHTLIHLDAPNRPMDYTQRNGRILRQGNIHKEMNKPVRVLRFGVEDSLDVTAYQRLKTKGAIADSIMNGKQMMSDSMTNRVLEEEEDVFGDTVAQLSGSEYAMLKNNAEKNVRKYQSRKKQWEADQTYIHNAKPRIKGLIKDAETRIELNSRNLKEVQSAFPDGKFKEITIGKKRFTSIESMEDFFKEHNKSVIADTKKIKDGEMSGNQTREVTIQIDGYSFIVKTELTKEFSSKGINMFSEVHRKMTYSCPQLGIENVPVKQALLRNGVEDIVNNIITGKDFAELLEASEHSKKHNETELEQLMSREGKPFEYEKELEQAQKQFVEYSELMKKEMAEKEAKYAEMDASVEAASDIANAEEDDVLYREDENETAPETAVQHGAGHSTVVSSADGAKILKDLDNTITEYKNKTSNRQKTFIGDLSRALNLRNNGNNSNYGSFIAINGKSLELRISDHNVSTKNMADAGKIDGISIVITHKPNKGINNDDSRAHIVEFYYNTQKLQKESGQPYVKILESIKQSLYSGEYKDNTGLAVREEVNEDAIYSNNEWYRTGQNSNSSPTRAQRRQMVEHAENLAKRLHLDNIEIVNSVSGLEGKKKSAKGFYDPKTGKITIVIPNNTSIADIEKTLLHEAVAHYGLRQLFGEHFDTFLDNVYNNVDENIRKRIAELAIRKYNYDFRKATEEYLASLAESTNFENAQQSSWWQKVKDFFADMLSKLGFKDFRGVTLTDNELRYILWRSYENLSSKRHKGVFGQAADIAKQYELGVGDYAKSSESEDDILFRDDYEKAMARYRYEARLKSGWYQTQEALQDSMLGLKEAMTAILEEDDINIEDVDGFENAYLGENRLSSVNKAEADAFANTLFKPMLDEVAKLAHDKTERETLTDYMMAKHGLERNEYMRQQAMQNGGDASRDFAGLTALTGFSDVMLAEAEAQRMVDDYEQDHDTTELWDKVNAVSKAILQKSYECGLMSKETFDDVSSMYQYYIPLRGFDEKTSAEAYAYLNHNSSAFNAPIRKAEGRKSKADDPFANLQSMAESAIMQGNRNRLVKQRFLNFVINHPSDLVSVSEIWLEYDAVYDEWKPVFPDNLDDNDTPEEVEQKFKDFEDKMRSLAQQYPDQYKHGRDTIGIPYRIVGSRDLSQHQVIVKRGGKDIILTVNGNPRLAQALNGQTNPDNDMSGAIGAILRSGEWVNRQLSAFYTTRNPDFIVSNFMRDMFYTNTMAWIKESPNYALRFHKNYIMVNPVTMKRLLGKYRKGTLDLSDKTELMFYQFMMNGGETGYVNIRDIEQHKNDIRKELKRTNGRIKIGRALSLLAERFDELNRAVENCARFAAFVTSREMGRTLDRSIYDAKEISVNFNKKGSGAKFYGSVGQTFSGNASALVSGLGRSGYVFWNAAIQGTTNFGRQVKRHPAKAFTGIAAMFLLGVLVAYLGGDDDEDKNAYYNLPEHVRRSNILFRTGDSWISIPLPIEYRAIYGMGELMTSVLSGKEHLTDGEVAEAIAGQVSQLLPIDFLEGGGGLNAFVPSVAKPLWEAYVAEKSWTGMPIYKDTPYNKNMPEWTKAYKSTNKHIVNLAATLNEATGGDRYTKGGVDINPAKIEYMLNGYFSGVWGTINKLSKTAETIAGEREYDPSNILLMNRLVKAGDERTEYRAVNNEYFRLKEEHDQLKTRLRKYENDTYNGVFDYAEKIDFLYNSPEYQRYEIFELYNKEINDINDILKETYNNEERKYLESELNELKKEMIQEIDKTRQTRKGA